jgi:hypothetical protein
MGGEHTNTPAEARWLRWSVAFVWLATGLSVLHPYYREVGHDYLARLGLPDWIMFATCVAEVLLGLRVALGGAATWLTLLQVAMILTFSTILACLEPLLLAHPYGVLTKNLPLLAVIGTCWLLEREGWTRRAYWLLRVGVAVIWITEGLFPKILFQQPLEQQVVAASGLVRTDPATFLTVLGAAETLAGVLVLLLPGRPLRWLLVCQLAALFVLPVLVSLRELTLWVHPFGPLIKNVPIIVATAVLLRREWVPAGTN